MLPHSIPFDLEHYESTGYGVVRQAVPAPLLAAMGEWLAMGEAAARQCSAEEQARDLVFEKDLSDAGRNGIPAAEVGDAIFILGDLCRYAPQFGALLQLPALVDACARALGSADLVAHFMNATTKHPGFGRAIRACPHPFHPRAGPGMRMDARSAAQPIVDYGQAVRQSRRRMPGPARRESLQRGALRRCPSLA